VERETDIAHLADKMTSAEPPTTLRIAVITAVQASVGRRVQTSATDTAWIPRSEDTTLAVGDRVWLIQQGAIFVVGGRLSGEPGASPIGAVTAFAGATVPDGWLACDGAAVSRTTYAGLFAQCGTTYGAGNGTTTFNVPNLTGRLPLGTSGGHVRGSTGGADTVVLTTANLPAHDHGSAGNHSHGLSNIGGVFVTAGGAVAALASTAATWVTDAGGTHTHSSVGSGTAVSTLDPFVAMPYIIRAL
jgi:microcystin-dependent protein